MSCRRNSVGSKVVLGANATKLASKGRPWFFADDLKAVEAESGSLVRILGHSGEGFGLGFYSERSKIRLRSCGVWPGAEVPHVEEFFARRLRAALDNRQELMQAHSGLRLVHGEGDQLPGLVVDKYADCLVLQSSSAVVEANLSCIVPLLVDWTQASSVVARNDLAVRKLEGLPQEVRLLHGNRSEAVEFSEHGLWHSCRPFTGQKTGFYLDQRPARKRVRDLAAGRRVLDLFSYQGGFTLSALAAGALSACAVDQSQAALDVMLASAQRNELPAPETICGNAFDVLRQLRKKPETYDLVVLDPPPFARSRREKSGAIRGYRDLNRQVLRLLAPGGYLITCSCSHHVDWSTFEGMLRQAAAGLPFPVILRERIAAGTDHPIWLSLPETEYLKVYLLQRPV